MQNDCARLSATGTVSRAAPPPPSLMSFVTDLREVGDTDGRLSLLGDAHPLMLLGVASLADWEDRTHRRTDGQQRAASETSADGGGR